LGRGIAGLEAPAPAGITEILRTSRAAIALVEYGMLVGLIAVICVVAVTTLGTEVSTAFSTIASALSGI
jgi:pilus assembly protein Flp/PilA